MTFRMPKSMSGWRVGPMTAPSRPVHPPRMSAFVLAALVVCLAVTGATVGREAQAQEPVEEFIDLGVTITVRDSGSYARTVDIVVSNHGNRAVDDVKVDISVLVVDKGQEVVNTVIFGGHPVIDTGTFTVSSNPSVVPNVWRIERIEGQSSYSGTFRSGDTRRDPDTNTVRESNSFGWKASVTSTASGYLESESRLQNNRAEAWQGTLIDRGFPAEADYSLMSSVDDPFPATDGTGTVDFSITVDRNISGRTDFGGYVDIELTPGLSAGRPTFEVIDSGNEVVNPTPSNLSYVHNHNDNTGRFAIDFSDTYQFFTMTLPVTVAAGATLNEQCLTAEIIAKPPPGPPPLDDPSDNFARTCLGSPLISEGKVSLFTWYDCVGETDYPCDRANNANGDGLEVIVAPIQTNVDGASATQPRDVIIHVRDILEHRHTDSGEILWSTGYEATSRSGILLGANTNLLDQERWGRPHEFGPEASRGRPVGSWPPSGCLMAMC